MRRILGEYVNSAPELLQFSTNLNGKPYISWPPSALQFNLSHSNNLCILAVRWGAEIGLDIEIVKPRPSISRIARRLFAPEVSQKLDTVCGEEQLHLFYYYWTRFEASIKAKGGGLFDANMLKENDILCVNFLPAPGFYGCIAAYDSLPAVEYWEALSLI